MEREVDRLSGKSMDLVAENIKQMRELFPECIKEGVIDLESLANNLGIDIGNKEETYSFNWYGKAGAIKSALSPSAGTLRFDSGESITSDDSRHSIIEGDNLEVLKLLQKSYHKKVKLIYIDPPYNTGGEFIYPDRFQDNLNTYLELTGQKDYNGIRFSSNVETSGRYHTNWLNMMYPRLKLARSLMRSDGAIFISIDHHELANLRKVCDEIFGEENFQSIISWQKRYTRSNNTTDFTTMVEYIVVYSKSNEFKVNLLSRSEEADARYSNPDDDPRGPWKGASFLNPKSPAERPNLCYEILNPNTGKKTVPTTHAWRRSKEEFDRLSKENILYWGSDGKSNVPSIKSYLSDARGMTPVNFWSHDYAGNTDEGTKDLEELIPGKVFDNPKPVKLLKSVIEHVCGDNDIVLDFFAGSGGMGQAVIEYNIEHATNHTFILVQIPESCGEKTNAYQQGFRKIVDITKRRVDQTIKRTSSCDGYNYFRLDSSNIKAWVGGGENLEKNLFEVVDNMVEGRSHLDVVYEVMLKYGIPLSSNIDQLSFNNKNAYSIGGGSLVICLEEELSIKDIESLGSAVKELSPFSCRIVFWDKAFVDDVTKMNSVQLLKQFAIEDIKSI